LFAEQGLKIRIRKDKSLGKHPSKRIFVDLPSYDFYEKKKTTFVYVGKYSKYGYKENERNNPKNEIMFDNEPKKIMNHSRDDYMGDPNYQNHPDMYNKYMNRPDNYYGERDYYNRDMRGPMGGKGYRDMDDNNMNDPMMDNRHKMNMKNGLNDEMNLSRYDNSNYRMPTPRNRNNMNDRDGNKGDISYYEESNQYSYISERRMRIRNSSQYMHNPPYQDDRRGDYIDRPGNYSNMMPPQNPPLDPYMNHYNHNKMYDECRNNYRFNPKDNREEGKEPMDPMERNDFYQSIPPMSKGDDYGRFRPVKMESGNFSNNSYNYSEDSMNNEYRRKRKYNSLDDNYMMNNGGPLFNANEPRKNTLNNGYNDMNRMMPRERSNNDYIDHKLYYNEGESKEYIHGYQYSESKRGNGMTREYDGIRNDNYYNNDNCVKPRPEPFMERGRPDGYNMPPNENIPYMNNEYPYRNNEPPYGNVYDGRGNSNRPGMGYNDKRNGLYERDYERGK